MRRRRRLNEGIAIMNQVTPLTDFVIQQEGFFRQTCYGKLVTWEKESQFAIQQLQKNNKLAEVAQNNLASLQNAIINVAAIGVSLNPASKHAYLVPRDGMVCLDISYIGLMHLAIQVEAIEWGQAKIVYEKDVYTNIGIDKPPEHRQNTFGDKGKIVGTYCTVKLKNGDYLTEEMDVGQIENIREKSKAKNGPWKTFYEEMARKSVVKRASKYWPVCDRLNKAVEVLNESEGLQDQYMQTSPEINDYTSDQKIYFDQMLTNNDCLGLYLFVLTLDESVYLSLYHSFEQGKKGKYQRLVDSMIESGQKSFDETKMEVFDSIAQNDSFALSEALCDCDEQMIGLIKGEFNSEQLMVFRELHG